MRKILRFAQDDVLKAIAWSSCGFLAMTALLLAPTFSEAGGKMPSKKVKRISILLKDNSDQIDLRLYGSYTVWTVSKTEPKMIVSKRMGSPLQFKVEEGRLKMGKKELPETDLIVVPRERGLFVFQGKRYRGQARVKRRPDGKIDLINILELEDYLKSVVAGEISAGWPEETLKAQAIAARTYAYYHLIKNKGKSVHISSTLAQNYQGADQEEPRTNAAVEATRGEILAYQGYIFPSFFHSTCGGGTEFPQNVWPLHFQLPEIVPCDYCKDSPYFRWKVTMTLQEIENKLKDLGKPVSSVVSVYPSKISKNRVHVTEVTFVTDEGEKAFRVNEFRGLLGYNVIKSARFKVQQEGERVVFQGWGWGHGVGMCQWGSRQLALEKRNCHEILRYYYPGCDFKRVSL